MRRFARLSIVTAVTFGLVIIAPAGVQAENTEPEPTNLTLGERLQDAHEAGATTVEELAAAVSLPTTGPGSMTFDQSERVTATVEFDTAPTRAQISLVEQYAIVDRVLLIFPGLTVRVPVERINDISKIPGVRSVTPTSQPRVGSGADRTVLDLKTAPASLPTPTLQCGPIPIEADTPLRSAEARARFGVDGTGVTVGVLSDSYGARTVPTSAADDVASGALPGAGNPCGFTTEVEFIPGHVDLASGEDEGRAMAQLVHGIAPGARIVVAGYGQSEFEMAENIVALAEMGADIIVDDITYYSEAYFQRGFISAAVDLVKAEYGVAYFTSAANRNGIATAGPLTGQPINGWTSDAYRPMACPSWVLTDPDDPLNDAASFDCLDFDPAANTESAYDTISFNNPDTFMPLISTGEPIFGLSTQLELRLYDAGTNAIVAAIPRTSPSLPNGIGSVDVEAGDEIRMVLVRVDPNPATPPPPVWIGFVGGSDSISQRTVSGDGVHDQLGSTALGHGGDGSAVSVASLAWDEPTTVRSYSSLGPSTTYFETVSFTSTTPAPALAQPRLNPGPHLAAVDGTRTTFFGSPSVEDGVDVYRFFGTSAAAPNAAAVAALGLAYDPSVSGVALSNAVAATARGTENNGPVNPYLDFGIPAENVFGAGIVDAVGLLGSLAIATPSGLSAVATAATTITATWAPSAAVDHYVIELIEGGLSSSSVIEASSIPAGSNDYNFTNVTADQLYGVRLTPFNASGDAGSPASTEVFVPVSPAPALVPPAPDAADLSDAHRAGLTVSPSTVRAGQTVTVSGAPARVWAHGWFFSDASAAGWSWTGGAGQATFTVPSGLILGTHQLALNDSNGTLLGWVEVTVTAPTDGGSTPGDSIPASSTALAKTGAPVAPALLGGALLLLLGAALATRGARRRTTA